MKDEVVSESQDYEGMSVIATEKLIELRERIAELKAEVDTLRKEKIDLWERKRRDEDQLKPPLSKILWQ